MSGGKLTVEQAAKLKERGFEIKTIRPRITNQPRTTWTDDEVDILKNNYCDENAAICELLPRHTLLSIRKKAKSLGLQKSMAYLYEGKTYKDKKELVERYFKINYKTFRSYMYRNNCSFEEAAEHYKKRGGNL